MKNPIDPKVVEEFLLSQEDVLDASVWLDSATLNQVVTQTLPKSATRNPLSALDLGVIRERFCLECYKAFCTANGPYDEDVKALKIKLNAVVTAVTGFIVGKYGITEGAAMGIVLSMTQLFVKMYSTALLHELRDKFEKRPLLKDCSPTPEPGEVKDKGKVTPPSNRPKKEKRNP